MPACNCDTYRCDGKVVLSRVYEEHKNADKLRWRRQAYETYQRTINKQDEALATEIGALTLSGLASSNDASPPHSPAPALPKSPCSFPKYFPSTDQSPIRSAHTVLGQLGKDLSNLEDAVRLGLPNHGRPSLPNEDFPLKEQLAQARLLDNGLTRASLLSAALRDQKADYSRRVQILVQSLTDASALWRTRLEQLCPLEERSIYDTAAHFEPILEGVDPIIQVSLFTMVALQIVCHLGRNGCRFILSMIRYIVQLAFFHDRTKISTNKTEFVENFPIDPESATKKFPLDTKETIYAVCPNRKCHMNYPPTFRKNSAIPHYPKFCTYKEFPTSNECGTALTRKHFYYETEIQVPIKSCIHFSFKDFLASLLSRPGFEDMMDSPQRSRIDDELQDVNDGEFLRTFTDADGKPFKSTVDVGRYSFSVCSDFFNPYTNKQSGKKSSIGIISVVCLSLPATHRYKAENMFLAAVLPGPKEPPLTKTNHYLTPIVNDFLEFWQPGVRFSKTWKCPEGRLILCALIIVVCDLLAARKIGGFASCKHEHFCSVCHCTRSQQGYGSTNYEHWRRRTNKESRAAADRYRTAATPEERLSAFDQSGLRWSELLRLPYFDINRCVIVDSMHNLFLGLLKEHFMGILGISLPKQHQERVINVDLGIPPDDYSGNDRKGIEMLQKWLQAPAATTFPSRPEALKKLARVNLNALKFVAGEVNCPPLPPSQKPTKLNIATSLLDWRLCQVETQAAGANTSTRLGHVLGLKDMEAIWDDIRHILTPSWTTSVPSNLGDASHGKLKADQWRTLGTIHLPLTLIRIWGKANSVDAHSVRRRRILEVTMSLVSAVTIATSRTTSKEHASSYLDHMRAYVEGIKELFPTYKFRPNHHMALHLHEFFILFGPVHSWWTYPFERMIGALQRMPHNNKLGELEATIARAYTRSANLRAILLKHGCPEVIQKSEAIFRKLVDPQLRELVKADIRYLDTGCDEEASGERIESISSRTPRPLPNDLKELLDNAGIASDSTGHVLPDIRFNNLIFSTSSKHKGNSCVILSDSTPARIDRIIQLPTHRTTYLAVRRQQRYSRHYDPYEMYPIFNAQLWSTKVGELELVSTKDVICHFACLPYDTKAVVILPLSREVNI